MALFNIHSDHIFLSFLFDFQNPELDCKMWLQHLLVLVLVSRGEAQPFAYRLKEGGDGKVHWWTFIIIHVKYTSFWIGSCKFRAFIEGVGYVLLQDLWRARDRVFNDWFIALKFECTSTTLLVPVNCDRKNPISPKTHHFFLQTWRHVRILNLGKNTTASNLIHTLEKCVSDGIRRWEYHWDWLTGRCLPCHWQGRSLLYRDFKWSMIHH